MSKYFIILLICVAGCTPEIRTFDQISQSGVLKVLTTNSETTVYEDRDGNQKGFEFDMISSFARSHSLEIEFIYKSTPSDLFRALKTGEGDIIAAGTSITKKRESEFKFGPAYQKTQQRVVCRFETNPSNISDLQNIDIIVGAGTSYSERLITLKKEYENLNWKISNQTSAELIRLVHEGKHDCTIIDSHILKLYRRYFPSLNVRMKLGSPQKLGWMMRKGNNKLHTQVEKWFKSNNARVLQLQKAYYDFVEEFDPFDLKTFKKRIKTRLPKYRKLIEQAAENTGWDWTLLAAISYQESHWNPRSKSPTGVRGFMMLTLPTAKAMGVKNRLDASQSIMGGARYLKKLQNRIPKYIPPPDNTWMTLAAYNVGFSHLRDARAVAVWKNQDPNSWKGVRQVLPLLSAPKTYARLPHGYARGLEPVLYVDRIRTYHTVLKNHLKKTQ